MVTSPAESEKSSLASSYPPPNPEIPTNINELLQGIRKKKQEQSQLDTRLQGLQRKEIALAREVDALQRRFASSVSSSSGSSDALKEQDARLHEISLEEDKLRSKITEKQQLLKQMQETDKWNMQRAMALEEQLANLQSKVEATKIRRKQLEDSVLEHETAVAEAQDKLREFSNDTRSIPKLESALSAAKAELKGLLDSQGVVIKEEEEHQNAIASQKIADARSELQEKEKQLVLQIEDERKRLLLLMESCGQQEDSLRKQIQYLRTETEALDRRHEQLASTLPAVSQPLLQQLNELQKTARLQEQRYGELQAIRREKIGRLEAELVRLNREERALVSEISELSSKISICEIQLRSAAEKNERMRANVLHKQNELSILETRQGFETQRFEAELKGLRTQMMKKRVRYEEQDAELKRDLKALDERIDALQVTIDITEKEISRENDDGLADDFQDSLADSLSHRSFPRASSLSSSLSEIPFMKQVRILFPIVLSPQTSTDELQQMGERLHNTPYEDSEFRDSFLEYFDRVLQILKEVDSARSEISRKKAMLELVSEELATATSQRDELQAKQADFQKEQDGLQQLEAEHHRLLEDLGAKEEKILELQADLADIQNIYKDHITHLLSQIHDAS